MTSQTEGLGLSTAELLDRAADLERAVDAALKTRTYDFSLHEQMRRTSITLLVLVSLRAQAEAVALQATVAEAAAMQQKASADVQQKVST